MKISTKHLCCFLFSIVTTIVCYKLERPNELDKKSLYMYINSTKGLEKDYRRKKKKDFLYFKRVEDNRQIYKTNWEINGIENIKHIKNTTKKRKTEKNKGNRKYHIYSKSNNTENVTEETKNEIEETKSEIEEMQNDDKFLETLNKDELAKIKSSYIHSIVNRKNDQLKQKEIRKDKWIYYYSEEEQKQLKEQIESERKKREEIHKQNNSFLNENFQYTSNFIPINVEKKYNYENFKYSEELVLYIFFIINLFKHEQFKNKIYKINLRKQGTNGKIKKGQGDLEIEKEQYEIEKETEKKLEDEKENWNITNNTIEQNNRNMINDIINKFGEKFTFFNPSEKIQREDWANIFKLEKEDKINFFKNIKIKNEKKKEHFLLIYYCNWQYACMALYNALHNMFHNAYDNIQFYTLLEKKTDITDEIKTTDEVNQLKKKEIEEIRQMYIKDLQNNIPMDMESLLKQDQYLLEKLKENVDTEGEQKEKDKEKDKEKQKSSERDEMKQGKGNKRTQNVREHNESFTEKEQGAFQKNVQKELMKEEDKTENEVIEKKKTWKEIMEEKKKKLDEEYFLYGYSQYENEDDIKKEEEEIKKTKELFAEENRNKTELNKEQDFKNIYRDFYLKLNNYNSFYNLQKSETIKKNPIEEKTFKKEKLKKEKKTWKYEQKTDMNKNTTETITETTTEKQEENKQEVNVNVIFVRISNSTVIGKTKNIKEKIKKKWIYCHQKEIKFYELVLATMLNENIYYKHIPHIELFTINYDTLKIYEFFNSVNTNLKHSFIHKNRVFDVFNNVVNEQMDVYNFSIYDQNKCKQGMDKKTLKEMDQNKQEGEIQNKNEEQKEKEKIEMEKEKSAIWQDDDIVIEEMDASIETDEEKEFHVAYDQHLEMGIDKNINEEEIEKELVETKGKENKEKKEDKEEENTKDEKRDLKEIKKNKKKEKKTTSYQQTTKNIKHNKKEKSKYEALFKQKYTNVFVNELKEKLQIEHISSISNFDLYANFTVDTFKDISLRDFLIKKKQWKQQTENNKTFYVDNNYIYYNNIKIPKELFPFFLQLSMAYKFEHTTLLINAPKKIEFIFRNP